MRREFSRLSTVQIQKRNIALAFLLCRLVLSDVDSDNSLVDQTLLSDYTATDGTITSQPEWIGKKLYFTQFFIDDYGNFEDSIIGGLFEIGIIKNPDGLSSAI